MDADLFWWATKRFRPREGWLSLALLIAALAVMTGAILEVNWTPEVSVVGITAVSSLILVYLLAKKSTHCLAGLAAAPAVWAADHHHSPGKVVAAIGAAAAGLLAAA
ncbi:MAG: hypothetical protein M5U34_03460 [Chloroflexi bacterium]|nr:hypothetical protein [Chloroflexota bacterium]